MSEKFEKLKELKQLLEEGLIDDQEYSQLKKELLEGKNQDLPKSDQNKEKEEDHPNKSHCPNCGSTSIQLKTDIKGDKDKQINWGRAVAGWALFGVVGGAVGGLTGKQKDNTTSLDYSYCLNCGTTWRAEDLYKTRQLIKEITGFEIDMSKQSHRDYLNGFMNKINPHFSELKFQQERLKKIREKEREKETDAFSEKLAGVVTTGCFSGIAVASLASIFLIQISIWLFVLVGTIYVSYRLGFLKYTANQTKPKHQDTEYIENKIKQLPEIIKKDALEFHNQKIREIEQQ